MEEKFDQIIKEIKSLKADVEFANIKLEKIDQKLDTMNSTLLATYGKLDN